MPYDPRTSEPILFEVGRTRRRVPPDLNWRDWRVWSGPLRPLWAYGPGAPLAGTVVGVTLAVLIWSATADSDNPLIVNLGRVLCVVALCLAPLIQFLRWRAFVTPRRLVHQYGIFAREEIALEAIERVEFDYSRFWPAGEHWDIGDLQIYGAGRVMTIASVPDPAAAAQAILDIKNGKYPEPS